MKRQRTGINPKYFHPSQIRIYLVLLPIILIMLLPILYILSSAFKPLDELFAYPPRFFVEKPTLNNFIKLFTVSSATAVPASRYLFNSILITAVMVAATLFVSVGAAYVFSKKRFRGKEKLFKINQLAMMFVPVAVTIPRYLVMDRLGILNTFWVHILPALATPVGLFLMKQFIDGVPDAIVEAAVLDGAGDLRILLKMIVPLIRPAMATVGILVFQNVWNATEASVLLIDDEQLKNFANYVSVLSSSSGNSVAGQGMAAAGSMIMFVPNIVLFIILQSRVMNTMMYTGVK